MTDKKDLTEDDFKYLRPGHVDLGRKCDDLVKYAHSIFPGTGVLPKRWRWISQESFNRRYGPDLGRFVWAKTASYHLLMINGRHAFRMWTDSPDSIAVDLDTGTANELSGLFEIRNIPKSTHKKTKPFKKRLTVRTERQVKLVMLQTLKTFGVM